MVFRQKLLDKRQVVGGLVDQFEDGKIAPDMAALGFAVE